MGWKSRRRELDISRAFVFQLLKNLRYLSKYIHLSVWYVYACACMCVYSEECGYEKIIRKLLSFTLCKLHYFWGEGEVGEECSRLNLAAQQLTGR